MNKSIVMGVALSLLGIGLAGCGGKKGHSGSDGDASQAGSGTGVAGGDGEGGNTGSAGTGNVETEDPGSGGTINGTAGDPVITSVPGDTVLSDLTPAEATQVCEETTEAMDPSDASRQRLLCTLFGLLEGAAAQDPVAACEDSVMTCMVAAAAAGSTETDCSGASDVLGACEATVDEVNACLNALSSLEQQFGGTLSCETTDATTLLTLASLQAASCVALEQECPGFTAQ